MIGLLIASFGIPVFAQNQNRPIEKAQTQREEAALSPEPAAAETEERREQESAVSSEDYTPFGVDVLAIILHSHQDHADKTGAELPAQKIQIADDLEPPGGLLEILESYLTKPASAGLLSDLAEDLVIAWRESDYPLVDIYFPEQNITRGKLQIVIREAVLGEVVIENASHTRGDYLKRQLKTQPGDRVNQRTVRAELEWLNENPIRTVDLIYDRGKTDGTSDIILQVEEKKPVTLYTGFANTGLSLTGENEFSAGINIANPFKTEQSIGYNYNADIDFDSLEAHTLFYQGFLPWRHKTRVIGAYVSSEAAVGDDFFPLDLEGENIQLTGEYEIPLPRPENLDRLRHAIIFGADYKSTNTNLIFGGLDIFDSRAAVMQFRAEYEATLQDELGYTRLNLSSVWAPGDIFQDNNDDSFSALREEASSDYWYGVLEIERGIHLPADFNLLVRATGQTTDARLISTEQLLAGGYRSVRGFDENLIRGDSGAIVNVELISPRFSIFPNIDDQWNALAFYDAAAVSVTELEIPAGEVNPSLQSAGVGFRFRVAENIFARAEYGWALDSHGFENEALRSGKMHFGVTVRY